MPMPQLLDRLADVNTVDTIFNGPTMTGVVEAGTTVSEEISISTSSLTEPTAVNNVVNTVTSTVTAAVSSLVSQTASATATVTTSKKERRTDALGIILGVIFGVVAIGLISLFALLCFRRKRQYGSFFYQDNTSEPSIDTYDRDASARKMAEDTTTKALSSVSTSPERPPSVLAIPSLYPREKSSGHHSPSRSMGRNSPKSFNTTPPSPASSKGEIYYPPLPAPHQISSLGRRPSNEILYKEYPYVNDPFYDETQALHNQHLQQQYQQYQQQQHQYPSLHHQLHHSPKNYSPHQPQLQQLPQRTRSRASSGTNTVLEPLREYPEHNGFREPRNPHPRDPRERALYNYRNSYQNQDPSIPVPIPILPSATAIPQLWLQPSTHTATVTPWHPTDSGGLGIITAPTPKNLRVPDMVRYKRHNRRWVSEPQLRDNPSKMPQRKPVPLPRRTPIPPLEMVKLPEFWWEQKHLEGNKSTESFTKEPLRRFSFESRPPLNLEEGLL